MMLQSQPLAKSNATFAHPQLPATPALPRVTRSKRSGSKCLASTTETQTTTTTTTTKEAPASTLKFPPFEEDNTAFTLNIDEPRGQAAAFGFLSATSGILASLALTVPDRLLNALLPAVTAAGDPVLSAVDPIYLRLAGATLLISAAVEFCLQDAATNKRLGSATYQRLMLVSITKNIGFLAAFALASDVWTPSLIALYPTAALASIVLNSWVFVTSNTKDGVFSMPNVGLSVLPNTNSAAVYSAFFMLYLATAGACYAPADAPGLFVGEAGPATELLKHTCAPGFALAAVAALNLKDAADRGRLGASTFKRLNLGIAGLEFAYSGVVAQCLATGSAAADFSTLANLVSALGIASYCFYQFAEAKK